MSPTSPPPADGQGFDVVRLARVYRTLVLWFGLQLVVGVASSAFPKGSAVAVIAGLVGLVALIAIAINAYRTASALGSKVPFLWAISMAIPCANIITLLLLSAKATKECRARGIAVGMLGPKI
jgi:hypothetical protein